MIIVYIYMAVSFPFLRFLLPLNFTQVITWTPGSSHVPTIRSRSRGKGDDGGGGWKGEGKRGRTIPPRFNGIKKRWRGGWESRDVFFIRKTRVKRRLSKIYKCVGRYAVSTYSLPLHKQRDDRYTVGTHTCERQMCVSLAAWVWTKVGRSQRQGDTRKNQ